MNSLRTSSFLYLHPFRGNNYYFNIPEYRDTGDFYHTYFYLNYQQEIPLFCYYSKVEEGAYKVYTGQQTAFGGKTCTKPVLLEVLDNAKNIQKVKYGQKFYYAAKGFLSEALTMDPFENIIFFHSVDKFLTEEDASATDFHLNINRKYLGAGYKKEEIIIKAMMEECEGRVVISSDPLDRFESRFKLRSTTIRGQKKELESSVDQIMSKLTDTFVKKCINKKFALAPYDPELAKMHERCQEHYRDSLREFARDRGYQTQYYSWTTLDSTSAETVQFPF